MSEMSMTSSSGNNIDEVRAAVLARIVARRMELFYERADTANSDQIDAALRDRGEWRLRPVAVVMSPADLAVHYRFTVGAMGIAVIDGETLCMAPPDGLRANLDGLVDKYLPSVAANAVDGRLEELETAWDADTRVVAAWQSEEWDADSDVPPMFTIQVGALTICHTNSLFEDLEW